jgi:hypothetical protein
MLKKKTVLVLGAGASKPFEYPTGIELSQIIVARLGVGQQIYFHLQSDFKFADAEIKEFRDAFFYSGKNSVDAFLEHRPEYMKIGKAATAIALIPYEQDDKLFRYDNNWLRYLYNNLNTSFDEFGQNQLSIVTFNYDRSVEHFFFTSLKYTYGKADKEIQHVLKEIPIIHLHGRLGFLPWQSADGRPYVSQIVKGTLEAAVEGIKIIHEDIKDGRDGDFEQAKALMNEAERVCFLGFGYNRTNLERLGVKDLPTTANAIGSSIGLGNQEKKGIAKACNGRVQFLDGDCLHFVREYLRWE